MRLTSNKKQSGFAFLIPLVWTGVVVGGAFLVNYFVGDVATRYAMNVIYFLSTVLALICARFLEFFTSLTNVLITFSLSSNAIDVNLIKTMWALIRDFANLGLIFILLYISISTVLGLSGGSTYKMLGKVILVGLLMNFSLLFTNIIVDSSNIIGLQFLNAIDPAGTGVGGQISSALNIKDLMYTVAKPTAGSPNRIADTLTMIGISTVLLAVAFVMAVGAGMFLVRVVKLTIIMMFAPLAFVATILPKTESYAKQWWEELFGNAFLAPAYLFMIYVSLTAIFIILNPNNTVSQLSLVNRFTQSESTQPSTADDNRITQTIFGFAVSIGLLLGASAVASKMSKETALMGGKFASFALGTAVGTVAATGRQTVGRAGQYVSDKIQSGKDTKIFGMSIGNLKDITGKYGEAVQKTGAYLGASSFDAKAMQINENIPLIGGAKLANLPGLGELGAAIGISKQDFGPAGGAGGIAKQQADARKRKEETTRGERAEERRLKASATMNKIKDGSAYKNADGTINDAALLEDMKNLNQGEQTELIEFAAADPTKNYIPRNITNRAAIKAHADKLDTTQRLKFRDEIMANSLNIEGRKEFYEENKKEQEFKLTEAFNKFFQDKEKAGVEPTEVEIVDEMKKLNSNPKLIVNVVGKVMANPNIQAKLQASQLQAMYDEYASGSGKINWDNLAQVRANANTPSAKKFFGGQGGTLYPDAPLIPATPTPLPGPGPQPAPQSTAPAAGQPYTPPLDALEAYRLTQELERPRPASNSTTPPPPTNPTL